MTDAPTALGALIKSKREARGLSLDKAAKIVGLSKVGLWGLETGENRNPTVNTIAGLARAYNVAPSTILKAAMEESK